MCRYSHTTLPNPTTWPGIRNIFLPMAEPKLTPMQMQRVEQITGFLKTVHLVKKLVGDLEANRAARPQFLQEICARISREMFRMRIRAAGANVGTVADTAGQLATMATRSTGLLMKIRGLKDGIASLTFQLDRSLVQAQTPEVKKDAQ
jgi:hypothetical protein